VYWLVVFKKVSFSSLIGRDSFKKIVLYIKFKDDTLWSDPLRSYVLWCVMIWYVMMCYDVLWCVMMCYDVLWCVMMCYDVLWCVMMCYIWCVMMCYDVLWCVLMCYDVFWCVLMCYDVLHMMCYDVLWCVMMCYDVLWCVMMCYDVIGKLIFLFSSLQVPVHIGTSVGYFQKMMSMEVCKHMVKNCTRYACTLVNVHSWSQKGISLIEIWTACHQYYLGKQNYKLICAKVQH
jgi:hypothetical protein